jgi:trk system potassium uptake protein TrkA
MRVIICGAGQVGYSIASYLTNEENDVTVVDHKPELISQINEDLDVNGIVGHASNPDILNAANANDADMIIAVTQSDEVNMVACQIGHSLFGIPKKIARIRDQSYLQPAWSNLFSRAHMPIDVIISPEVVIAQEIYKRLSIPGTTHVSELAGGRLYLLGIICGEECPLIDTPLHQISNLFPDLSFRIVAILRKSKPVWPDKNEQLHIGDEAFFIVDKKHLKRSMAAFGHEEKEARRVVIAGGGAVGYGLATLLKKKSPSTQFKIIERNVVRSRFLSERMENTIILNGSSLDKEILEEASISNVDTYVAVTNDDESNILGSLLAKQYGCSRVITLVNNNVYSPLVGPLGIDTMVSPRLMIVATIMQHVRRGRIKGLHNLRDGFVEVIEAEISESSKIVNTPVGELKLPGKVMVAAIIRDDEMIMPKPEQQIRADDHVIVVSPREQAHNVEKMFSVQVDLF